MNHQPKSSCAAHGGHEPEGHGHEESRLSTYARLAGSGLLLVLEWLNVVPNDTSAHALLFLAAIFLGFPLLREALISLRQKRMTMALSMVIAIIAALSLAEFLSVFVIIFFVLLAEEIEHYTLNKGESSVESLLDFLPSTALVESGGEELAVPLKTLKPGTILIVKPGARLVADGTVVSGHSFVNEAAITGEPLAAEKLSGKPVFAGSINENGVLRVLAERIGQETVFGKIVSAVRDSRHQRGEIQKLADRFAAYLVYFSLALAAVTLYATGDWKQTISVIIVSGACGIAAGTPLAILGATARAAHFGAVFKGGMYVEKLSSVDTVVFDKTGTLTKGQPVVEGIICAPGQNPDSVLKAACSAESHSDHPLAKAVLRAAQARGLKGDPVESFAYIPGAGIKCIDAGQTLLVGNKELLSQNGISVPQRLKAAELGNSLIFVAKGGQYLGTILLSDEVRPEASTAVSDLRKLGLNLVILSGDRVESVQKVAQKLGITTFQGGLKPEDKLRFIQEAKKAGRHIAMVGDGINDAPALSSADVGVALASGTDIATASSNLLIIGSDLRRLTAAVRVARQCRRVVLFNFWGTLAVDAIGLGLALAGLIDPISATLIHVGTELAFLSNSARLLPVLHSKNDGCSGLN